MELLNILNNILLSVAFAPINRPFVDTCGCCCLAKRKSVEWITKL